MLSYSDPYVPELRHGDHDDDVDRSRSCDARDGPDCVVICTDHAVFNYDALLTSGVLIVDTRNALKDRRSDKIFRL